MREALDGAPPEVASCIESSLGENIIAEINDGTFLPNADTGDVFRSCFENFYRTQPIDQTDNETGKRFNEFDNEDVDDPNRPHDENPDAALGDSEHTDRRDDFKNFDDFENFDNSRDDDIKDFYSDAGRFIPSIENLSPEAIACVVSNLGPTFETDIYSGNIDPSQVREVLQVCASDSTTSKFEQDISHDILPPEDTSENDFQFDKFGDEFIQNTDGQGFIPEDFQQGFQEVPAPAPEEYFEGASPTEYQDTPQQQSSLRQFMASTFQATIGLFGL
ncbi:MAG TPA: hypothetical protein ENI66_01715 [Candidatus Yonathbacteria bacterium]|nr:hypothetical protein [Candidatus Yonathbacteria bacterium]